MNVLKSLKKYYGMISDGKIPYYWNDDYNLLSDVSETTLTNIRNRLKRIINEIEKNPNDPFIIAKYLGKNSFIITIYNSLLRN